MNLFSTTRAKVLAAVGAVAATAAVGTAAYAATTGPARAPYAQAAALVGPDGTVYQSKGIKAVTHPSTGVYCLTFTSSLVDPQKVVPQATIGAVEGMAWGPLVYVRTDPSSACNSATDTVTVFTGNTTAGPVDQNFYFSIS